VLVEAGAIGAALVDDEDARVLDLGLRAQEHVEVVLVLADGSTKITVWVGERRPFGTAPGTGGVLDRDIEAVQADVTVPIIAGLDLPFGRRRDVVLGAGRGLRGSRLDIRLPCRLGIGAREQRAAALVAGIGTLSGITVAPEPFLLDEVALNPGLGRVGGA
jgi:hypothetical protein